MKISLFCILIPDPSFVPPPFVPLSEPRALSAGCLPGREAGGHVAKRQALWIFYEGEGGVEDIKGGVNEGENETEGGCRVVMVKKRRGEVFESDQQKRRLLAPLGHDWDWKWFRWGFLSLVLPTHPGLWDGLILHRLQSSLNNSLQVLRWALQRNVLSKKKPSSLVLLFLLHRLVTTVREWSFRFCSVLRWWPQ